MDIKILKLIALTHIYLPWMIDDDDDDDDEAIRCCCWTPDDPIMPPHPSQHVHVPACIAHTTEHTANT